MSNPAESAKAPPVAIITGAGSGIGRAVARAFLEAGYAVALAGRREHALQETVQLWLQHGAPRPDMQDGATAEADPGPDGKRSSAALSERTADNTALAQPRDAARALVVPTDVTDPDAVNALFDRTVAHFGRVDVLFNNAGIGAPAVPLETLSPAQWRAVVDTNLNGPFFCTQAAFRVMKAQTPRGGRIINNGSVSAHAPRPMTMPYTATKHAMTGLTKAASLDGRAWDIACGQIDIGNAMTEMARPMAEGILQADGRVASEPTIDVALVAQAVLDMARLPLSANVLAIPWVGLVLTPMAIGVMLLAPVFPWLAGWLLKALLLQLGWLMAFLRSLDALPLASIQLPRPGVFALGCALLGAVLMLAPEGLRRPRLGMLCLLPLLLASPRHAQPDALVVTALDIGQGSMIVVEQGDKRLLYDTGASRLGGRSAIDATLVPWLNSRGLNGVDVLVVSHLDAHHAGGAARAMAVLNPSVLLTAMDPRLLGMDDSAEGRFQPCLAGTVLPWADGAIEVLQPQQVAHTTEDARQDQNSCVIRVRSSAGSVLLAGDLPARAEAALVKAQGDRLPADVLVVPQEGGRQGTGKQLLAAVQPTLAVVQTTHRNQHGRPDAALVERLENQGTRLLRTDRDGAVRIVLRQGQAPQVTRSRIDGAPYWRVRLDDETDGTGD